jgi:hypothetical protein
MLLGGSRVIIFASKMPEAMAVQVNQYRNKAHLLIVRENVVLEQGNLA